VANEPEKMMRTRDGHLRCDHGTPLFMKSFSLVLAIAATVVLQATAVAQSLSGSAEALRDSLRQLSGGVEEKIGREDGRGEIMNRIDKAREDLKEVRDRAAQGVPRYSLSDEVDRVHERVRDVLTRVATRRSDRLRDLSGNVYHRLNAFNNAWRNYGPAGGYGGGGSYRPNPLPGVNMDARASRVAREEVANNLRIPVGAVSIIKLDRSGNRYRVYAGTTSGRRYSVDLDGVTGRVYSVTPIGGPTRRY
jgi:hypothetical protein